MYNKLNVKQFGDKIMHLILNEPSGEDFFDDKKGSARSLADRIVAQLDTPEKLFRAFDGRMLPYPVSIIGLDGEWGSGKSNVLEMVKQRLLCWKRQSKFIFFEYDFWRHRLDLTRKMFLEELVDYLCSRPGRYLPRKWQREVEELTGKTFEKRRRFVPELNWPVLVYLVCLLSAPYCLFVGRILDVGWWGGYVSAMPAIVAVITVFLSPLFEYFRSKSTKRTWRGAFARSLWIMKGKSIESVEIEFRHDNEPSIVKFTEFLKRILHAIGKNRVLVVVLDNMDRLSAKEVVQCMAAIHVLFAEKREMRPRNFRIIVPYDAVKVGSVFSKVMGVDVEEADDYFRRTFDLVYRVSPQLGSNWEKFFDKCYDVAALNDDVAMGAKDEIRAIINYLIPLERRNPRKLIAILNEIAEIKNSFHTLPTKVKMKDIAVFACAWPKCKAIRKNVKEEIGHERAGEDARQAGGGQKDLEMRKGVGSEFWSTEELVVSGEFIENCCYRKNVYLQGTAPRLAIAAIVYQTTEPFEVLGAQLVLACLKDGSSRAMAELADIRGFESAYERILGRLTAADMEESVRALCGLPRDSNYELRWNRFYTLHKETLVELHVYGKEMLQGFERSLLLNIGDYVEYASRLRWRAGHVADENRIDYRSMRYIANRIQETLEERGGTQITTSLRPVSAMNYLEMLREFKDEWELAGEDCNIQELDGYCAERASLKNALAVLEPLRYLDHKLAVQMRLTVARLADWNVEAKLPDLNVYLCMLENLVEGVIPLHFGRVACDEYLRWMDDPPNRVSYEFEKEEIVFRVVAIALRCGGFPYSQKDVQEVLSCVSEQDKDDKVGRFISIASHYHMPDELRKSLRQANRNEMILAMAAKRLGGDAEPKKE